MTSNRPPLSCLRYIQNPLVPIPFNANNRMCNKLVNIGSGSITL
jgi:hypothetical protein